MGSVRACLNGTCASRPVASSTAPYVTIEEPARAAFVELQPGVPLVVKGTAANLGDGAQVRLNGQAVELSEDGRFEVSLAPRFGVNQLRAEASDFNTLLPGYMSMP